MARLAGTSSDLLQVSDEERLRAERVATAFSEEDLTRFLNSMLRTFDDLGYRQEQRFHLELGLLKLVHMQRLLPLEELFRDLSLPSRTGGGSGVPPPRLAGTNAAPKQLESSLPRTNISPPAAPAVVRSPIREEFKQPAPPLNETAAPVIAESHPLQGMFGASAAPAVAASKSVPATTPRVQTAPSIPPKQEVVPAPLPVEMQTKASAVPATAPTESSPVIANRSAAASEAPKTELEPALPPIDADVDNLRAVMSQALTQGGHETAGYMLESGTCEWNGNELRVRVAASKTLFDMMYPAAAQQLVKEVFRQNAAAGRTIRLEPGDPAAANGKKPQAKTSTPPPIEGGMRPQDHPLIRHAQQLFSAEVRSVVSLRDSQASKS